jgi:hypothetical protein
VTRHDGAAPASGGEGFDLFPSLEPIVANGIKPIRQIEVMRLATVVLVNVSPIIREQLIESAPQRQVAAVEHCFAILLKPVVDEHDCRSHRGTAAIEKRSRQMFKEILMLIARLRAPPAPA